MAAAAVAVESACNTQSPSACWSERLGRFVKVVAAYNFCVWFKTAQDLIDSMPLIVRWKLVLPIEYIWLFLNGVNSWCIASMDCLQGVFGKGLAVHNPPFSMHPGKKMAASASPLFSLLRSVV
ncbi:hypothetical protein E8K88_17370 [Lampropedia aestuarii]|uniref:Uncharacterized protein n=1 Tax=Lampropedia aestuarii TaxID=2562762 RepID=A0A4V3YWB7_9BURK|nr:hypothetical protein [Lampropedia aestuarii]THJ30702.1 hypothetical protein E8K88_17370 [Lampropedia aestuarii]